MWHEVLMLVAITKYRLWKREKLVSLPHGINKQGMKRAILYLAFIVGSIFQAYAQQEIRSDSLPAMPDEDVPTADPLPAGVKSYGGFLLDMSLMQTGMPAPFLSKYTLVIPDASKDYSFMFRLDPNVSYTQGTSNRFSWGQNTFYSNNPFGLSTFDASDNLQMGSFRLNNGMRINTYGQYNKDGWRVPSHNALPWERNSFKGAFELKSANGNFGIRVEVQQRR